MTVVEDPHKCSILPHLASMYNIIIFHLLAMQAFINDLNMRTSCVVTNKANALLIADVRQSTIIAARTVFTYFVSYIRRSITENEMDCKLLFLVHVVCGTYCERWKSMSNLQFNIIYSNSSPSIRLWIIYRTPKMCSNLLGKLSERNLSKTKTGK